MDGWMDGWKMDKRKRKGVRLSWGKSEAEELGVRTPPLTDNKGISTLE